MILVDTSVWVDYLRKGDPRLSEYLERFEVSMHPFVRGELALGTLRERDMILASLAALPSVTVADEDEVLRFIASGRLWGTGIGYVDAHLLAAVHLSPGTGLWTRDKRLKLIAHEQGVAAPIN